MSALRILALSYLASASVFVVAATLVAHPQMSREFAAIANGVSHMMADSVRPREPDYVSPVVRLTLSEPDHRSSAVTVAPEPRTVQAPEMDASVTITILPDLPSLPKPPAASPARPIVPRIPAPDIDIARNNIQAAPAFRVPDPPLAQAPVTDRATAVSLRLRNSLTADMLRNFDLFLYVSKADKGPLAQRLYVFRKTADGDLKLAYDWAASTGREKSEISPAGHRAFTATPRGYYELDPARMYRSYRSVSWDQDMPNAMFFNWERAGLQTGLAIHAASGDDIARLGSRASAGCVHLAPEHAATLFNMIRANYRGPVPRFAYNSETQTMSNSGAFMHDRAGRLKMADGYRVLVTIEDYGGENIVASLF